MVVWGIVPLLVIPIGLLIGAVILRAAVAWYNKMAGAGSPAAQRGDDTGYSPNVVGGADSGNPFAAPTTYGSAPPRQTVGVPEPGFGWACGIVFVTWLASIPVLLVSRLVAREAPETSVFLGALSLPINFLVAAAVLKGMLPTARFGTACLIQLLQFVIGLMIVVVIAIIFVAIWVVAHR